MLLSCGSLNPAVISCVMNAEKQKWDFSPRCLGTPWRGLWRNKWRRKANLNSNMWISFEPSRCLSSLMQWNPMAPASWCLKVFILFLILQLSILCLKQPMLHGASFSTVSFLQQHPVRTRELKTLNVEGLRVELKWITSEAAQQSWVPIWNIPGVFEHSTAAGNWTKVEKD